MEKGSAGGGRPAISNNSQNLLLEGERELETSIQYVTTCTIDEY
jgi:hypothetical protein